MTAKVINFSKNKKKRNLEDNLKANQRMLNKLSFDTRDGNVSPKFLEQNIKNLRIQIENIESEME